MGETIYYFGCHRDAGHHMWRPGMDSMSMRAAAEMQPWGYNIDSGLCPKKTRRQGVAVRHFKDGWTAIAFWDNTIDDRPGSHSTFLVEGQFSFEQMVEMAREQYPSVWARLTFTVMEVS